MAKSDIPESEEKNLLSGEDSSESGSESGSQSGDPTPSIPNPTQQKINALTNYQAKLSGLETEYSEACFELELIIQEIKDVNSLITLSPDSAKPKQSFIDAINKFNIIKKRFDPDFEINKLPDLTADDACDIKKIETFTQLNLISLGKKIEYAVMTLLSYAGETFPNSIDVLTATPERNASFFSNPNSISPIENTITRINSFQNSFKPGSPAMIALTLVSAFSTAFYFADRYLTAREKEQRSQAGHTWNKLNEALSEKKEQQKEQDESAFVFNLIHTVEALKQYQLFFNKLKKDLRARSQAIDEEKKELQKEKLLWSNMTSKEKRQYIHKEYLVKGFNAIKNFFDEHPVGKAISVIWKAVGMYSMLYWVMVMTLAYVYGVGYGGALTVLTAALGVGLGTGLMFGLPAIIPLLFIACYGAFKVYQTYKANSLKKNLETDNGNNKQDVNQEFEAKQKELEMEDDFFVNEKEKAERKTYVVAAAIEFQTKIERACKHPTLGKVFTKDLDPELAKQKTQASEIPSFKPEEHFERLSQGRMLLIFLTALFAAVTGYMVWQFAFGPGADAIAIALQNIPGVGEAAALIANTVIGLGILALCIGAVIYWAAWGKNKATENFKKADEVIKTTVETIHEENYQKDEKKLPGFFFDLLNKAHEKAEEGKNEALKSANQAEEKFEKEKILQALIACVETLHKKCDTLSKKVDDQIAKQGIGIELKEVYNPRYILPDINNHTFREKLKLTPSRTERFREFMTVIFLPWLNRWGSFMYIPRSLAFIFAFAAGMGLIATTSPVLIGLLVTGMVLGLVLGGVDAYKHYKNKQRERDIAFLVNFDESEKLLRKEAMLLSKREDHLIRSLDALTTLPNISLNGSSESKKSNASSLENDPLNIIPLEEDNSVSVSKLYAGYKRGSNLEIVRADTSELTSKQVGEWKSRHKKGHTLFAYNPETDWVAYVFKSCGAITPYTVAKNSAIGEVLADLSNKISPDNKKELRRLLHSNPIDLEEVEKKQTNPTSVPILDV